MFKKFQNRYFDYYKQGGSSKLHFVGDFDLLWLRNVPDEELIYIEALHGSLVLPQGQSATL